MGKGKILLINPPVYDFSAFDFWMKPYGLLKIARRLLNNGYEIEIFDFMHRQSHLIPEKFRKDRDRWGRGKFPYEFVKKPDVLKSIPRKFKRYGVGKEQALRYLSQIKRPDYVLVTCPMTYWYLGVEEVIKMIRAFKWDCPILVGGRLTEFAKNYINESFKNIYFLEKVEELKTFVEVNTARIMDEVAVWEYYDILSYGVIRITEGCPFRCTYCSSGGNFRRLSEDVIAEELRLLKKKNVKNIAFYDDALLEGNYIKEIFEKYGDLLKDFTFHTPNALHSRKLLTNTCKFLKNNNFKNIYVGYEFGRDEVHKLTGGKTNIEITQRAIENLLTSGFFPDEVTLYVMCGHPLQTRETLLQDLNMAFSLKVRVMLSEFSPVPGTPDGDRTMEEFGIKDPLLTNNSCFAYLKFNSFELNSFKNMVKQHNKMIAHSFCK